MHWIQYCENNSSNFMASIKTALCQSLFPVTVFTFWLLISLLFTVLVINLE